MACSVVQRVLTCLYHFESFISLAASSNFLSSIAASILDYLNVLVKLVQCTTLDLNSTLDQWIRLQYRDLELIEPLSHGY